MLWPFCPAPEFTEAIIYRTDLMPSYSSEQRMRLTGAPRQAYNYVYRMTHRAYERASSMIAVNGINPFDLPTWVERQRVTVSGGSTTINIDTTASSYQAGGKAVLWSSDERCEVVDIDSVTSGSITLDQPTTQDHNGFVMPAADAYCLSGLSVTRSPQPIQEAQTEWMCYIGQDLSDASLYDLWRGLPVVDSCPRIGADTWTDTVTIPSMMVDNGLAKPVFRKARKDPQRDISMQWMTNDPHELWGVRQWLYSRRGMQKAFWLPTWTKGFDLAAPVSPTDATMTIRRLHVTSTTGALMVKLRDGAQHYVKYTGATPSGQNEVLALDGVAGFAASPDDVSLICPLHCVRLAQDRIELSHQHTGHGQISTIRVMANEVPEP